MNSTLVETTGNEKHIYDSVLLDVKNLKLLGNPMASKIVEMLAHEELCAIDIARKLKVHEQNIYYHLRNLEKAGVVKVSRSEMRYGMTAKMYQPIASVVAAKLFENGHIVEKPDTHKDPAFASFMKPFIVNGKLNATVVVGDPYSHGKYDESSREGTYTFNFASMIGRLITEPDYRLYKLDTEFHDDELKENLILFGNPKTNAVIDKFNKFMPIFYDAEKSSITSTTTSKVYNEPRIGYIVRMVNPFNRKKHVLALCGIRSRGFKAAILAFTEHFDTITKGFNGQELSVIAEGKDADSDKVLDTVKILERVI